MPIRKDKHVNRKKKVNTDVSKIHKTQEEKRTDTDKELNTAIMCVETQIVTRRKKRHIDSRWSKLVSMQFVFFI